MERCRADFSPAQAIVDLRTLLPEVGIAIVSVWARWIVLGVVLPCRAVVRHEHDQRVVVLSTLPQVIDQTANVMVEVVDHGGVDFHLPRLDLLLLRAQLLPARQLGIHR
ncbi:hypothetical protein D3C81_1445260 [compost metagenome]